MTSLPVWISGGRTDAIPAFFTNLLHRRSQWPLLMDTDYQRIFSLDNPTEGAPTRQRFTARHDDKANILMADGHVGQAAYGDTQWSQQNLNREGLYDR
jgi:prepilin-type processing-associated H-X9-DG protein